MRDLIKVILAKRNFNQFLLDCMNLYTKSVFSQFLPKEPEVVNCYKDSFASSLIDFNW